jgi:hypothetical protein
MLKPREEWPDPGRHKSEVVEAIEKAAGEIIGSNYEISQPIQLRVNELISGVRSDVGVKIFGDDLDILQGAAKQVEAAIRNIRGATDVKTEQVAGLPILTVKLDRQALSRYGLRVGEVQNFVEIAVGGKAAGKLFEGDRRFDIVVRLPERLRGNLEAIRAIPIPLPTTEDPASVALSKRRCRDRHSPRCDTCLSHRSPPSMPRLVRQAAHRGYGERSRTGSRILRRGGAAGPRGEGEASSRLLDRMGWTVRAARLRDQAVDDRRARGAAPGVLAAVHEHGIGR